MSVHSLNILLIDDDPSINFLNKLVIEKSPVRAEVKVHTDASEALEEITKNTITPKMILLDINMPVMDGWEFAQRYEQLPESAQSSKIFILSSSISPNDKKKAEQSPVIDGFFSKPLTIDMVNELVKIASEN